MKYCTFRYPNTSSWLGSHHRYNKDHYSLKSNQDNYSWTLKGKTYFWKKHSRTVGTEVFWHSTEIRRSRTSPHQPLVEYENSHVWQWCCTGIMMSKRKVAVLESSSLDAVFFCTKVGGFWRHRQAGTMNTQAEWRDSSAVAELTAFTSMLNELLFTSG